MSIEHTPYVRISRPRRPARIIAPYEISGVTCIQMTAKAIKVDLGKDGTWFPRKTIHRSSQVQGLHDTGTLRIHRWWAERQGWIH